MQIRRTDTHIKFLYVYWCVKKINHKNMMNLDVLHKVWFDSWISHGLWISTLFWTMKDEEWKFRLNWWNIYAKILQNIIYIILLKKKNCTEFWQFYKAWAYNYIWGYLIGKIEIKRSLTHKEHSMYRGGSCSFVIVIVMSKCVHVVG